MSGYHFPKLAAKEKRKSPIDRSSFLLWSSSPLTIRKSVSRQQFAGKGGKPGKKSQQSRPSVNWFKVAITGVCGRNREKKERKNTDKHRQTKSVKENKAERWHYPLSSTLSLSPFSAPPNNLSDYDDNYPEREKEEEGEKGLRVKCCW